MDKKTTTDDLILYLCNETPLTKTVLIQKDIDNDPDTGAEFENLKKAHSLLDLLLERPSSGCYKAIADYSRRLHALPTTP